MNRKNLKYSGDTGHGNNATNMATVATWLSAAAVGVSVGVNFYQRTRSRNEESTARSCNNMTNLSVPPFLYETIKSYEMTSGTSDLAEAPSSSGKKSSSGIPTSVSVASDFGQNDPPRSQRWMDIEDLVSHQGEGFTDRDLEKFSNICRRELKMCIEEEDFVKINLFNLTIKSLREAQVLRGELKEAVNTGNDKLISDILPQLTETQSEIRENIKKIEDALKIGSQDGQEILREPQDHEPTTAGRLLGFFRATQKTAPLTPRRNESVAVVPSTLEKRILRSSSSLSSEGKKERKRKNEECTKEDDFVRSYRKKAARAMRKNAQGQRLCQVQGCPKVADGKRSNFMCRRHYRAANNDTDSMADAAESPQLIESQVTAISELTLPEEECFYCEVSSDTPMIRCINERCRKMWHLECQNELCRNVQWPEYDRDINPDTFRCTECQASELAANAVADEVPAAPTVEEEESTNNSGTTDPAEALLHNYDEAPVA